MSGGVLAAPKPFVVGHGVQDFQRAMEIQLKGVSAAKVVHRPIGGLGRTFTKKGRTRRALPVSVVSTTQLKTAVSSRWSRLPTAVSRADATWATADAGRASRPKVRRYHGALHLRDCYRVSAAAATYRGGRRSLPGRGRQLMGGADDGRAFDAYAHLSHQERRDCHQGACRQTLFTEKI